MSFPIVAALQAQMARPLVLVSLDISDYGAGRLVFHSPRHTAYLFAGAPFVIADPLDTADLQPAERLEKFVVRQLRRSAPVLPVQYFALSDRHAAMPPILPAEAIGLGDIGLGVALLLFGYCAAANVAELNTNAAAIMIEWIFMSASFALEALSLSQQ